MKCATSTIVALVLLCRCTLAADITNLLGAVYSNAKITRVEPDGITVMHSGGIAKLYFPELPAEMQQRYGYDPEKAKQYRVAVRQAQVRHSQAVAANRSQQPAADFPVYVFDIIAIKDKTVKNISGISAYLTDPSLIGQGDTHLRPVAGGLYRIRFSVRNNTASDLRALVKFGDFQKEVFVAAGGRKEGEEISGIEKYPEMFVIVNGQEKAYPLTW